MRYDFAYSSRDTISQAAKQFRFVAPGDINHATGEIDRKARDRISQVMNKGDKQVQNIAPQILRGAIEKVYKTPFTLLGKLSKNNLCEDKQKENI